MSGHPSPGTDKVRLRDKLVYGAAGPVDIWATWVPRSVVMGGSSSSHDPFFRRA